MVYMNSGEGITLAANRVEQLIDNEKYTFSINECLYASKDENENLVQEKSGFCMKNGNGELTDKQRTLLIQIAKRKKVDCK